MYNATSIKTGLNGFIGYRQNIDSGGVQISDAQLIASSSGLYYNDVHPLITIDNLLSIAPDYSRVFTTSLDINNSFSAWLRQLTETALLETIDDWFAMKQEYRTARNLLGQADLFSVTGNITDLDPANTNKVGIEIIPARSKSLRVIIEKIGVQFDTDQTITLYLMQSGRKTHLQTVDITYTGGGAVQWETVNWELKGEGSYMVVYDHNAILGNSINGIKDHTYLTGGFSSFPTGRFYGARAFEANAATVNELWDLTLNQYTLSTNYGLNLSMHVGCDYTDLILQQKDKFKQAFARCVAIKLLRQMAFNAETRVNRNESNINIKRAEIMNEIEGTPGDYKKYSLLARYQEALKSIQFDDSEIDRICLPCRKRTTQIRAIGPTGSPIHGRRLP